MTANFYKNDFYSLESGAGWKRIVLQRKKRKFEKANWKWKNIIVVLDVTIIPSQWWIQDWKKWKDQKFGDHWGEDFAARVMMRIYVSTQTGRSASKWTFTIYFLFHTCSVCPPNCNCKCHSVKTLGQVAVDLALLTANANQLRYLLVMEDLCKNVAWEQLQVFQGVT